MNLFKVACFALAIAAVAAAFLVYPLLPAMVPTHWNAAGNVDAYGPAWMGAFLFPVIMAFALLVFVLIPKVAVFKANLKGFERQYWALGLVLQIFFLLFYALTLAPNYGLRLNMSQPVMVLVALLFIAVGALMPSFKRNFFVGIRTPWTLASDTVWEKTHRLGGKFFIASGILALPLSLFPRLGILLAIVPILVTLPVVFLYSFLLFRRGNRKQL